MHLLRYSDINLLELRLIKSSIHLLANKTDVIYIYIRVLLYLLNNGRSASFWEPFCIQVMQFVQNCLYVSRPNVLSSINSEPCYTNVNEMVHIVSHLGTNIIFPKCKIQKARQTTISDLLKQIKTSQIEGDWFKCHLSPQTLFN